MMESVKQYLPLVQCFCLGGESTMENQELPWTLQASKWVCFLRNKLTRLLAMETALTRVHLEIQELQTYLKILASITVSPDLPSTHMEYCSFVWQL